MAKRVLYRDPVWRPVLLAMALVVALAGLYLFLFSSGRVPYYRLFPVQALFHIFLPLLVVLVALGVRRCLRGGPVALLLTVTLTRLLLTLAVTIWVLFACRESIYPVVIFGGIGYMAALVAGSHALGEELKR